MSDIFLKSDAVLDQKLSECNDPERIREITKAHFAASGTITRERGNDYGARFIGQHQHEDVPLAASGSGFKYEREVRFAESTGKRTLIIRANTLEDLIALERQVTQ